MRNAFKQLIDLLPKSPLQVGDVIEAGDGQVAVELPGGGVITARGDAGVGDRVFIRNGLVEGPAPDLPFDSIDI